MSKLRPEDTWSIPPAKLDPNRLEHWLSLPESCETKSGMEILGSRLARSITFNIRVIHYYQILTTHLVNSEVS